MKNGVASPIELANYTVTFFNSRLNRGQLSLLNKTEARVQLLEAQATFRALIESNGFLPDDPRQLSPKDALRHAQEQLEHCNELLQIR